MPTARLPATPGTTARTASWSATPGRWSTSRPPRSGRSTGLSAAVRITANRHGSHAVLRVRGIEGADGLTFGAHLHSGPCVAGDPDAALGHYNVDPWSRSTPRTEVWLDFTVDDGRASASASVPFVPLPGTRSVVIHAEATDPDTGAAGPRLACLPVVW